jgi:hypothetical protein
MIDDIIEEKQGELLDLLPVADKYELSYLFGFDFGDDFVNNFVKNETKRLIFNEFVKFELLSDGFLHYNLTLESFDKFCNFFIENCLISNDSARKLVEQAVELKFNFLLKPLETLESVIFRGEATKMTFDILLGLQLFSQYHIHILYYSVNEYEEMSAKDMTAIVSSSQFVKMIRALDEQFHKENTIAEFVEFLAPVFEFFGDGEPPKVQVKLINEILRDKELYSAIELLEEYYTESDLISSEQLATQMSKIETNVDEQVDIEHDEAENVDFPALEDNDLILESKEEITEISSEADEDFYLNHIEQIDTAEDFYIVESGQTDEIEQTDKTE